MDTFSALVDSCVALAGYSGIQPPQGQRGKLPKTVAQPSSRLVKYVRSGGLTYARLGRTVICMGAF